MSKKQTTKHSTGYCWHCGWTKAKHRTRALRCPSRTGDGRRRPRVTRWAAGREGR